MSNDVFFDAELLTKLSRLLDLCLDVQADFKTMGLVDDDKDAVANVKSKPSLRDRFWIFGWENLSACRRGSIHTQSQEGVIFVYCDIPRDPPVRGQVAQATLFPKNKFSLGQARRWMESRRHPSSASRRDKR